MVVGKELEVEKLRDTLEKMIGYAEHYFKRWPSSDGDKKALAEAREILVATPAGHLSDVTKANAILQNYIDTEVAELGVKVNTLKKSCGALHTSVKLFRDANPMVGRHVIHNPQLTQRAYEISSEALRQVEASHV